MLSSCQSQQWHFGDPTGVFASEMSCNDDVGLICAGRSLSAMAARAPTAPSAVLTSGASAFFIPCRVEGQLEGRICHPKSPWVSAELLCSTNKTVLGNVCCNKAHGYNTSVSYCTFHLEGFPRSFTNSLCRSLPG